MKMAGKMTIIEGELPQAFQISGTDDTSQCNHQGMSSMPSPFLSAAGPGITTWALDH